MLTIRIDLAALFCKKFSSPIPVQLDTILPSVKIQVQTRDKIDSIMFESQIFSPAAPNITFGESQYVIYSESTEVALYSLDGECKSKTFPKPFYKILYVIETFSRFQRVSNHFMIQLKRIMPFTNIWILSADLKHVYGYFQIAKPQAHPPVKVDSINWYFIPDYGRDADDIDRQISSESKRIQCNGPITMVNLLVSSTIKGHIEGQAWLQNVQEPKIRSNTMPISIQPFATNYSMVFALNCASYQNHGEDSLNLKIALLNSNDEYLIDCGQILSSGKIVLEPVSQLIQVE